MAGLGFKDFQVGEVLTSSDVDGYLMQQSVMRFADSAARGSALGTAPGTAVALAEGMVSYLDDTNRMEQYVSGWTPVGNLVQAVGTASSSGASTTSSSFTSTGLSLSITPVFADSRVLVICSLSAEAERPTNQGVNALYKIDRGGTTVVQSTFGYVDLGANTTRDMDGPISLTGLDSPATTSSVTYDVQFAAGVGTTAKVNIESGNTSTLVLLEVRP